MISVALGESETMRVGFLAMVTTTPASSLTVTGKAVDFLGMLAAAVEGRVDRVEEAIVAAVPGAVVEETAVELLVTV
jgi:hypothetical protein